MRTILRAFSQLAILAALASLHVTSLPAQSFAIESASTVMSSSRDELEHGIADRLKRVEEFRFIEQEAANLGVRAWLFGGTAAGYAHYVKWDLQREKGDPRFQPDRFDYDYTNIYRSTQDLDIVIDGNARQAQALQRALTEKYPHLQGSKTAWEVRLLTQDMEDKQAILNNPDFMNQHTDSNSTGMIEITAPKPGERVVRDVRDWNSKEPYFLKDVYDGALHYYFSPNHGTTKFAREGKNPPILSAIRYLTKAFQYELTLKPDDLAKIKQVINEFDPKRDTQNSYVAYWIEKNGKKLIQNAVSIEYARDTLERLGLRKKLAEIKGDANTTDSLAWWMNKEPLRSKKIGEGTGKTAQELGLDIVAHETNNFLAYESITRAHTGDPNVLISRNGAADERAVFGDGFYVAPGGTGMGRSTHGPSGITIRFHLDPNARENTDFISVVFPGMTKVNQLVIKNKAALRVIPESLNIGPVQYFQMLAASGLGLNHNDQGILEKLKRRIGSKVVALTDVQRNEIADILRMTAEKKEKNEIVVKEWFSLPFANRYPDILELFIRTGTMNNWIVVNVLSQPQWKDHPELVDALIKRGNLDGDIAIHLLTKSHWKDHPEWIETLIKNGKADLEIAIMILSDPHWKAYPNWVEHLLKRGKIDGALAQYVLSKTHWQDHPEWIETLIKRGKADYEIAMNILTQPYGKGYPEWVKTLINKKTWNKKHDKWIETVIETYVLSQQQWKNHPELRRLSGGAVPTVENIRKAMKLEALSTSKLCLLHRLKQFLR